MPVPLASENRAKRIIVRRETVYFGLDRSTIREIRKRLKDKFGSAVAALDANVYQTEPESNEDPLQRTVRLYNAVLFQQRESYIFESTVLIRKAEAMAVQIPSKSDKPSWWDGDHPADEEELQVAHADWLSPIGIVGLRKLIRGERRKTVEWWVKIATPVLAALISLLGLVVALVTVSRK